MVGMHYEISTLPNGLRLITEYVPGIRSIAVGIWVDTGSRDENDNEVGASHFLEHLLFKGSEKISSREISERFDAIGAESNAFTAKDHTCFWARLLDEDLEEGLELLGEMIQRPAFRSHEIDAERQVVVEEINEAEDDSSDRCHELFYQTIYEHHPLGIPVLGTRDSVFAMTRDDITAYWKRRYGASSTVLAMAGSINHQRAVESVLRAFGDWSGDGTEHRLSPVQVNPKVRVVPREIEQVHLILGGSAITRDDDRRYPLEVMNYVLGGGMASRLFSSIREDRGLAYSVYSFRHAYQDVGSWAVYVATTPRNVDQVLEVVRKEVSEIAQDGISEVELARAKGAIRGGLALAMEDPNSRMIRLGRDELMGTPHWSVDERLARLDAITLGEVRGVAGDVMTGPTVLTAVGPLVETELEAYL